MTIGCDVNDNTKEIYETYTVYRIITVQNISSIHKINSFIDQTECVFKNILSNIGTKCNSLTQQFIGISTTIDTWATRFDSIESSSGPQRLQIQFLQGKNWTCSL